MRNLLALSVLALVVTVSAHAAPTAMPVLYQNCANLNEKYPHVRCRMDHTE